MRFLVFYPERGNCRYLILGTGKSCERAIAEALIVDEIESGGDESIEQPEGHSLIHRPAEDVPAERQRRYLQP